MPFSTPLQEGTHHQLLAQEKNLNSVSIVENWIVVDILKGSVLLRYYPMPFKRTDRVSG